MQNDKNTLRADAAARRDKLAGDLRENMSRAIADRVLAWPTLCSVDTVLIYSSMRSEVETGYLARGLYALGKRVCYPRIDPRIRGVMDAACADYFAGLVSGPFGVLQPPPDAPPIPPLEVGLILAPGLAFTRGGARLGYGGGYYDRFIALTCAVRAGVCFCAQIVESLPQEEYDMQMDLLFTETETVNCHHAPYLFPKRHKVAPNC